MPESEIPHQELIETASTDDEEKPMTAQEREVWRQALLEKAATDTLDFSEKEIRELVSIGSLGRHYEDDSYKIAQDKLSNFDLRKSFDSLLREEYKKKAVWQRALYEKAATDSLDFSEDEIRELIYTASIPHASWGDDDLSRARRKLPELGDSINYLVSEEALKMKDSVFAANAVQLFQRSENEAISTESRETIFKLLEKFPGKHDRSFCHALGRIGKPEDVPKLLSLVHQEKMEMIQMLLAAAKIAVVSQIPEIEEAAAEWEKKHFTDNQQNRAYFQSEVEMCLASIRREPEDVSKLLAFLYQDDRSIQMEELLRTVGDIAAVSQIPEIEKALAEWEKGWFPYYEQQRQSNGLPYDEKFLERQQKYHQEALEKCLAKILERNVQWTPPSGEAELDAE